MSIFSNKTFMYTTASLLSFVALNKSAAYLSKMPVKHVDPDLYIGSDFEFLQQKFGNKRLALTGLLYFSAAITGWYIQGPTVWLYLKKIIK